MGPEDELAVADFGRLRHPGGARRENPERSIGERDPWEPSRVERIAAQRRNRKIQPALVRPAVAVDPHLEALPVPDRFHDHRGVFRDDDHAARVSNG